MLKHSKNAVRRVRNTRLVFYLLAAISNSVMWYIGVEENNWHMWSLSVANTVILISFNGLWYKEFGMLLDEFEEMLKKFKP